jgi:hypothetical protein
LCSPVIGCLYEGRTESHKQQFFCKVTCFIIGKPNGIEDQEVSQENAVGKLVNGRKKWHRGKKQAAERRGVREASSRVGCLVTKNEELDLVEGSAPHKDNREAVRVAGEVGAPATPRVMAHSRERERGREESKYEKLQ